MRALGQVSTEYLVITGFVLVVSGLLFSSAFLWFTESAVIAQAEDAGTELVNNANLVASLGEGSRIVFQISLPEGIRDFRLENRSVYLRLEHGAGISDLYFHARPNLTPVTLPLSSGRKTLSASFADGNVAVSEVG